MLCGSNLDLLLVSFGGHALSMFSKHRLPKTSDVQAPYVALQEDLEDLYAENLISANRCQTLIGKAHKAGVKEFNKTAKKFGKTAKNAARALTNRRLKNTKWPDKYWAEVRVWDKKTQTEGKQWLCIHLIHEILDVIFQLGLKEVILSEDNLDKVGRDHLQWMRDALSLDDLLGFGIHGDGVPCNYDRTESVEVVSLNLPGVGGAYARMRIPLIVLPHSYLSDHTMDDLMEILAWSMRHALAGTRPLARHDGSPWLKSDRRRSKKTGDLGWNSCLVEVRSDWDFLNKCFHFPTHSLGDGICWKCNCKRKQVPCIYICNKYKLHVNNLKLFSHLPGPWLKTIHGCLVGLDLGVPIYEPTPGGSPCPHANCKMTWRDGALHVGLVSAGALGPI